MIPAASDAVLPWDDMRNACYAARQAAKANWPPGPDNYGDLFSWAHSNACTLLYDCPEANANCENLRGLTAPGIVHHDAYSGLGTAPISLKQQLCAMGSFLDGQRGRHAVLP